MVKNEELKCDEVRNMMENAGLRACILKSAIEIGSMAVEQAYECISGVNCIKEQLTDYFLLLEDYCDSINSVCEDATCELFDITKAGKGVS